MLELKILFFGSIVQFICYCIVGVIRNDVKLFIKILSISSILYLLIGITLTFVWPLESKLLGECGTERFGPIVFVSILGNLINIGIFGLCYLLLLIFNWIIELIGDFGFKIKLPDTRKK